MTSLRMEYEDLRDQQTHTPDENAHIKNMLYEYSKHQTSNDISSKNTSLST